MKLSQIEQDIYDFCVVPRTSQEIMEFIGHKWPPYGALRYLQRIDLIDKIADYDRAKATFVQSGRTMKIDSYMREVPETCMVIGVRI